MLNTTLKDPRAVESQFADLFPLLNLKETGGSGSVHSNGDLKPKHQKYDDINFSAEFKSRFTKINYRPQKAEWIKALKQLRSNTVRLFIVVCSQAKSYHVWISVSDWSRWLSEFTPPSTKKKIGEDEVYELTELEWMNFYKLIDETNG